MAIAKKCDLCGKYYDSYNEKKDSNNTNGIMFINIDDQQKFYKNDLIDLSPECMESIKKHVERLKSGKIRFEAKAGD